MSEVIMVLEEPWYNTLTEQMFEPKHNKDKYGKRYCPCSLIRDEDTVCMCKEFREMEEGTCHCQLYVKTKE